jgi:serine protease
MNTMKRNLVLVLVGFLVLGFTGVSFGQELFVKDGEGTIGGPKWVPGEIIVRFIPATPENVIANLNSKHGTSVLYTSPFAGFKRLRIPRGRTLAQMVEIYKRNPNVEYAELNFIAHAFIVPDDPLYSYQWHLDDQVEGGNPYGGENGGGINVEPAWDIETGNPDVIVAVIDTGVAYENYEEAIPIGRSGKYRYITYQQAPDLAGTNFVDGYDFVNADEHPNDDEGHGTHVTGTIAQNTNNNSGVAGVAFDTSIMPIKVLDSSGSGTYADIADGIYYAANNGANIINMSLGGASGSTTLEDAVANAYGKGVTIVCASGNDGSATTVSYPAAYDAYCIAVGATRYDEAIAYYSNGGPSLDLTAPGGDIYVDQNGDGYGDGVLQQTFGNNPTDWGYWFYQGTSMAAPHVSGVAALLIANAVATTPDEVRETLQSTAEDKGADGWDTGYGWGIVDAYAALTYTQGPNNPPVADSGVPYTGTEDTAITFDGSGSSDLDGDPLTYAWDFGDGSNGSGVKPAHVYTAGGEYKVTLVVNDGKADSEPSSTTATIEEVNDPPVADAGPDQSALVGENVTFDGSDSYDPDSDGSIISYDWDFGDETTGGGGGITTHAYSAAGTYTVTLTVTDNGGLTDTDTAIVPVTEQGVLVLMHVVSIEMSTKKAGPNVNAIAIVTVVDADGFSVAGATVSGHWSGLTDDIASGLTDETGSVSLKSNKVRNTGGTFTFTVDDITKDGWSYDSEANDETSDSIIVP